MIVAIVRPAIAVFHNGLNRIAPAIWPTLLIVTTLLVLASPSPVPKPMVPDFALMLVFLAAGIRSNAFPVWLCFLVGLLADLLHATPFGMQALAFVLAHAFAASQRRYFDLALLLWSGFALAVLATSLLNWVLVSVYAAVWLHAEALVVNTIMTVLVFPVVAKPMRRLLGEGVDAARR